MSTLAINSTYPAKRGGTPIDGWVKVPLSFTV